MQIVTLANLDHQELSSAFLVFSWQFPPWWGPQDSWSVEPYQRLFPKRTWQSVQISHWAESGSPRLLHTIVILFSPMLMFFTPFKIGLRFVERESWTFCHWNEFFGSTMGILFVDNYLWFVWDICRRRCGRIWGQKVYACPYRRTPCRLHMRVSLPF